MTIFYLLHLHPVLYVTISASLFLGVIQGFLSVAHVSFLMNLSQRITGLFHQEDEESRQIRRTCVIRRVARAFQVTIYFVPIVFIELHYILLRTKFAFSFSLILVFIEF